jgi:predicted transcriptional regulator
MRHTKLTRSRKQVLKAIIDLSRRPKLPITRISLRAELSINTVRRCIDDLEAAGLLEATRSRPGMPYDFNIADEAYQELGIVGSRNV